MSLSSPYYTGPLLQKLVRTLAPGTTRADVPLEPLFLRFEEPCDRPRISCLAVRVKSDTPITLYYPLDFQNAVYDGPSSI